MEKFPVSICPKKCVGCGLCAADCVCGSISVIDGKAQVTGSRCLECGHCFAICPSGAVSMSEYDGSQIEPAALPGAIDPALLLRVMKSRRSVRQFSAKKVSEAELAMLLEAGRFCPTAKNMQDVHFTVITNVAPAEEKAWKFFSSEPLSVAGNSFFKGAPLVILISAIRPDDAGLAASYMELMAHSLGLGAFYSGYFTRTVKNNPELMEYFTVPEGKEPVATLVIGHPAVSYARTAPRKPLNVNFI